jgi:hypothetical protein
MVSELGYFITSSPSPDWENLGMAKPVADATNWGEIAAGFVSDDSLIQGFSQLHDSGKPIHFSLSFTHPH